MKELSFKFNLSDEAVEKMLAVMTFAMEKEMLQRCKKIVDEGKGTIDIQDGNIDAVQLCASLMLMTNEAQNRMNNK